MHATVPLPFTYCQRYPKTVKDLSSSYYWQPSVITAHRKVLGGLSPFGAGFIATWLKILDLYCAVGVLGYCHPKGRDDMQLGLQPDILKEFAFSFRLAKRYIR